jgi:hypothetical protein
MTTTRRVMAGLALVVLLATSAAPASARFLDLNANGSYVQVPPPNGQAVAPAATIVKVDNGFAWGDAAIGAAAGVALTLVCLGGVLAVSQHRSRRGVSPAMMS